MSSHIDEYYFDDFTVSTTKKEKNNHQKIFKIQSNESKKFTIENINKLPKNYCHSNTILTNLVKENKLLEIYDGKEVVDNFYETHAKINRTHEDFKNLTYDEVLIRIPSKYKTLYEFSTRALYIASRDLKKTQCKTRYKYCYFFGSLGRGQVVNENLKVNNISLDVFNHENKVILSRIFIGISLNDMLKLHPKNRMKIMIEILQLLHEVCDDSQLWKMKQNLGDNILYCKNKWTLITTSYYSCSYSNCSFKSNLRDLAKLMGTQEEYRKIFKNKFWKCKDECIFAKEFKEVFCD